MKTWEENISFLILLQNVCGEGGGDCIVLFIYEVGAKYRYEPSRLEMYITE
jgi:hypothetical protein